MRNHSIQKTILCGDYLYNILPISNALMELKRVAKIHRRYFAPFHIYPRTTKKFKNDLSKVPTISVQFQTIELQHFTTPKSIFSKITHKR